MPPKTRKKYHKFIIKRMKELELSPTAYALGKHMNQQLTTAQLQKFLAGESDIMAENLDLLAKALGGRLTLEFPTKNQ